MEDDKSTLLESDAKNAPEKGAWDVDRPSEKTLDSTAPDAENIAECCCAFFPKRYVVVMLALLGFSNAYALRVNLSVAMVAMVNNITLSGISGDKVEIAEFDWDTRIQGVILGSFFFGYIVTQIPGGYLASIYGGKNLFGTGVLVSSILTLLTPSVARTSVTLLIVLRIFEGIFQGVLYSSNHTVMSHWAPVLERSKMVAATTSGAFLGTVVTLPISGILTKWYGWPSVFYFFGISGIMWSFLWFVMVTDTPRDHQKISKKELEYIESSLQGESTGANCCKVPWKAILTSLPVWGIVAAHFSQSWGYYTLLTTLPTYLKKVLNIDLLSTGFLSSIPYLAMTIVLFSAGLLSDFLRSREIFSTTCVRKFCVGTGFFFQAVFLASVGHVKSEAAAITLVSLGVGMGGLIWGGFGMNHIDIAPRYAGLLMGISNCFATISGIVGPPLAGALTPNETPAEWKIVFYISAAVCMFGMFLFCFLASGEKQEWNDNEYSVVPTSPEKSAN